MELSKAKVLVTGGAKGLGNFIACGLLDKVSIVFVIDNDEQSLSGLLGHAKLVVFQCDLTKAEEVERIINTIFKDHGGVNVCINNAGIIHSEPLVNFIAREEKKHSVANWKKVIDINLNAVFYVTSNVVERMIMKKEKGVIINISSISAQGNTGQSAYSASKAAVEALTKTWSKEWGIFKIRCSCIAPGFFNTSSTKQSLSEGMLAKWQKSVPLGRLGEADEILLGVEFIIINEYFNGKVLSLDGGLTI